MLERNVATARRSNARNELPWSFAEAWDIGLPSAGNDHTLIAQYLHRMQQD
jgi:hypothetical protein